jgi:predicted nucleic acid-binding Zn ribbon protein
MSDTPSGADLARQALARARSAAKTAPAPKQRTPRRARREMGGGRDPRPLGSVVDGLAATEGWADSLGAGNLTDRWRELCPTVYADTTHPVGYDPDTATLTIRAASHTIAAGLRLAQLSLAKTINDKLGRAVVRRIRITIGTGMASAPELGEQIPARPAAPEAPVRTREDGCPGYQDVRAVVLEHRPERPPADPYVDQAMCRQESSLRANREPEPAFTDAVAELERLAAPAVDRAEQIRRAAIARKRSGDTRTPRRAFDTA